MRHSILFYALSFFIVIGTQKICKANIITVNDMILVNTVEANPFLIDIFETSNKLASSTGIVSRWTGRSADKPARFNYKEAKSYCQSVGKKLPTLEQWMIAASNLGKNKSYTLKDDTLYDANGNFKPNTRNKTGHGSLSPYDFGRLGIDAVGSVGMTGNRAEWVIGPKNTPYMCGMAYETEKLSSLQLKNICVYKNFPSGSAGSRCIIEINDQSLTYKINYTSNVRGELLNYLNSLKAQVLIPADLESFFIQENRWSTSDDKESLLELTDPF